MRKILPAIIILIILLLLGGIFWLLANISPQPGETPAPDAPDQVSEVFPVEHYTGEIVSVSSTSPKMTIKLKNSSELTVNDFRQIPNVEKTSEGFYDLDGSNPLINLPYSVLYSELDDSFSVSLNAKPLLDTRKRFSEDFLKLLNISEAQACNLNVFVGVTYDIDPALSGTNLGLSYCQDSSSI